MFALEQNEQVVIACQEDNEAGKGQEERHGQEMVLARSQDRQEELQEGW